MALGSPELRAALGSYPCSMQFSANLGFLFQDRPMIQRIAAAAQAGFTAAEFHRPYEVCPPDVLKAALASAGLPAISLNTQLGNRKAGERGICALPDREADARADIARAISYAATIGARGVNVLAGVGGREGPYVSALRHATEMARAHDLTILIEPQNSHDHPGYFLDTFEKALRIQDRVGATNLRILFDCYHVHAAGDDPLHLACTHIERIGHIQIAGTPARCEPDSSSTDYAVLLPALRDAGYAGPVGAEYHPRSGDTEAGLGWLHRLSTPP